MKRKILFLVATLILGGGILAVPVLSQVQSIHAQEVSIDQEYRQIVLDLVDEEIIDSGLEDHLTGEEVLSSWENLVLDNVKYENEEYHLKSEYLPEGFTLTDEEQRYLTEYLHNFKVSVKGITEGNSTDSSDQGIGQSYQEVIDAYVAAINGDHLELRGGQLNVDLLDFYVTQGAVISYTQYDVDQDGVKELLILADNLVIDMYSEAEGIAIQYLPMDEVQSASEIIILTSGRVIINDTGDGEIGEFKVYDLKPDSFELNLVGQYQYNFAEHFEEPVYDVNEDLNLTYEEFQEVMGYNDASVIDYSQLEIVQITDSEEESMPAYNHSVDFDALPAISKFGLDGIGNPHTIDFYPGDRLIDFNYPSFDGSGGDGTSSFSVEYELLDDVVIEVLPSDLSRQPKEVTVNSQIHIISQIDGVREEYKNKRLYIYYNDKGTVSIAIPEIPEEGNFSRYYLEYDLLDY